MRSVPVYRKLVENVESRRFDLVATPAQARPGDILVSPGHSRIIVDTRYTETQALLMTLAESTSRTDMDRICMIHRMLYNQEHILSIPQMLFILSDKGHL